MIILQVTYGSNKTYRRIVCVPFHPKSVQWGRGQHRCRLTVLFHTIRDEPRLYGHHCVHRGIVVLEYVF